ncbi:NADP-dependent isocitrate dehydrogenase [Deinococcus yavapaiensis]|uniref:Isocitrate dehydrogenase [NADP] n=1 Tax=Deinococcus yavapaiensis KR-236 TaxID=694435 RepID=A0A318S6M5_9DEIO|nr:NADP-dependent isocitrate dehydrogenase [Deinococcus yavapaiensis]PYE54543.1 isocitrate dehydrogenase [Deinococcus yavapaiensis KR-236]
MTSTLAEHTNEHPVATPITVAYGDGIGPEIMEATLRILEAGGAKIAPEVIEVGESVYLSGVTSGIPDSAWDSIARTGVLLKAPITTPQGSGYKSLNVTLRKSLGLYANVRPTRAYAPFVPTLHPQIDVIIVRENEEDLYAGIEHRQTDEVTQCLKLITRDGCERIVRYAFELARAHGRKKVTAISKDNIMKLTDGLFHKVFDEIGKEYPDLQQEHMIVDIAAARLATRPERFDVIVTLNLYGDILSDIAADVAGSVGLAGSSNIGVSGAMFEAIHGSAPDIAGQNVANPGGLLHAAILMLAHIGQGEAARQIHNAWLRTIEDGVHTKDIAGERTVREVGTNEFADAVIERLGQEPRELGAIKTVPAPLKLSIDAAPRQRAKKELVGVDVFLDWSESGRDPDVLAEVLVKAQTDALKLEMITNRGVKVWPQGHKETLKSDHWRCRFSRRDTNRSVSHEDILKVLSSVHELGLDYVKTEHLCLFDGVPGYALGQGQ